MARPKKENLDYFPFDVDFFDDDKLFDVQNEYGPLGEMIYLRLLCLVYSSEAGYYYKFDSLDKLAAKVIRSIGNRWVRNKETVKDVISFLAKCNLFSSELMQENILTSRGIQRRYAEVVKRRQFKIEKYNLLEEAEMSSGLINAPKNQVNVTETQVNVTETKVNVYKNPTKESKVKENKIKENKREESKSAEGGLHNSFQEQFEDLDYRQILIEAYGEDTVKKYEMRFNNWVEGKKNVRVNKYEAIDQWLCEDFG